MDTWVRRKAGSRVHAVRVPDDLLLPATFLGAECTLVEGPIVARCGVKMNGRLFRIPDEYVDGWRRQRHTCPTCEFAVRGEPSYV